MRRLTCPWLLSILAIAMLTLAGCGGSPEVVEQEAPVEQAPAKSADAPPAAPVPQATEPEAPAQDDSPAAMEPAETAGAIEAGTPGDPAALIGTSWLVGDMHITFESEHEVFVRGGMVADVAPEGLKARYVVREDGSLEATAMGMTMTGFWDGAHLMAGGVAAQRQ